MLLRLVVAGTRANESRRVLRENLVTHASKIGPIRPLSSILARILDGLASRSYLLVMEHDHDHQAWDARDALHYGEAAIMAAQSGFEGFAGECALLAARSAFLAYPELREGK